MQCTARLKGQEGLFGGLWEADSASAKESFADTFMQLRDWVMKCRGEGREILEDVLALVEAPRLQIILSKFKSRTSTGLVDVKLQDLKGALCMYWRIYLTSSNRLYGLCSDCLTTMRSLGFIGSSGLRFRSGWHQCFITGQEDSSPTVNCQSSW